MRQVGGTNDHPATPTFLQIYRIISTFSIIKPPTSGNCTVREIDYEPISLTEIRNIFKKSSQPQSKLESIKNKFKNNIQCEDWDFDNQFTTDHDDHLPDVNDCAIYCYTAHISDRFYKTVKCDICKKAFASSEIFINDPITLLANIQNERATALGAPLVHPVKRLYNFIQILDRLFVKHCESKNVCELVLDEVLECNILSFPCLEHMHEIISIIVQYFLQSRMITHSNEINKEDKKRTGIPKKLLNFAIRNYCLQYIM